ncbi:MAG: HAD family hydrolase [Acidimicrobiaceae bacterium]|nr:HAD family hydrolase [Acidimicrobiaceae bacterium]
MAKIRAVTFDLWNTLLTSSPGAVEIRSRFWSEVVDERGLEIDADLLHGTLSMLPDRFDEEWRAGRQYGPTEALADCFTAFGDRLTSEDRDALAAAFEAASYELEVAPVADAADVLSAVAATGVAVGIISDTALATGRHLRTYLDAYGILQHVTFAAFSDEVGVYKPDPAIFAAALDGLGIGDPATAAHVGDLKRTDVAGARAMGMSTVRFRGVVDDPEDGAEADHVIDRLADLPRVLGPG